MPEAQTNLGQLPIDPQQGFGFHSQPHPAYLNALDNALSKLDTIANDPRNMWMAVGMPWLYHGTSASRAASILKKGFDPARIGEIWGHAFGKAAGQRGPGVYFSESPELARGWGEIAADILGEKPTVVRAFVPKKKLLDVTNTANSPSQAMRVGQWAQGQGYQALKFGNQVVVPDPTSIPLRNIRPFPGPSASDQAAKQLWDIIDSE